MFFFFLLSFFLSLINNLCLDYFYGNHNNEQPLAPSSQCKRRIGQGRGQQKLKPSVCFFFLLNFYFFFFFFLLNVYFQEIYHDGNEQPLPPLSTKQMRMSNVYHHHHTNNGQKTGQSNRGDNGGSRHDTSKAPWYVSFHYLFIFYLLNIYLHLELLHCNVMMMNGHHHTPSAAAATVSTGMSYICVCFTVLMTI